MSRLTIYVIKEISSSFLFTVTLLTGILWMGQSLRHFDLLTTDNVEISAYFSYVFLLLPKILQLTTPIALFISILFILNRLKNDSELIVLWAAGKSNRNIFPVLNKKTNYLEGIILLDDIRSIMFDQSLYEEIKASDVMQNPPEVIKMQTDNMTKVMQKFQDSGAWNLPVIKDGKYYGFVSKSKLLTAYRRKLISFTK